MSSEREWRGSASSLLHLSGNPPPAQKKKIGGEKRIWRMGGKNKCEEETGRPPIKRSATAMQEKRLFGERGRTGCCWEWEDEQFHRGSSRNQAEMDRDQTPGKRRVRVWLGKNERRSSCGRRREKSRTQESCCRFSPRLGAGALGDETGCSATHHTPHISYVHTDGQMFTPQTHTVLYRPNVIRPPPLA